MKLLEVSLYVFLIQRILKIQLSQFQTIQRLSFFLEKDFIIIISTTKMNKNKNKYDQFNAESCRSVQGQSQKYSDQGIISESIDVNISNNKGQNMDKKQWCRNFYMYFMTVIFMALILILFAFLVFVQNQNEKVKDEMYSWMKNSLSQNAVKTKMMELSTAISNKDIKQKNQFVQILDKLDQQVKNNKNLTDQLINLKNDYKQISENMKKNKNSSDKSKEVEDLINEVKSLSSSFNNFQIKMNADLPKEQQNKIVPNQKKIQTNQTIKDKNLQINPFASLTPLSCTPLFTYIYIWIGDLSKMPLKYKKRLIEANYPYRLLGIRQYQRYEKSYKLSVQIGNVSKSDLLRVSWLEQFGGIYSDLDVDIDYCCIQELIGDKKGLMFPTGISNAFMISTQPGSQFFRSLVKDVNLRQNNTIVNFMGPRNYDNWNASQVTAVIDFGKCLNHTLDFTWRDEKNKW